MASAALEAELMDDDSDNEGEESSLGSARSLASRMLRAASNALWRREDTDEAGVNRQAVAHYFVERAKYIPLRLELRERKLLRLIESLLSVSPYTDVVDAPKLVGTPRRSLLMMREFEAILSGLIMSCDYEAGRRLVAKESAYADYTALIQQVFETVRPGEAPRTVGKGREGEFSCWVASRGRSGFVVGPRLAWRAVLGVAACLLV